MITTSKFLTTLLLVTAFLTASSPTLRATDSERPDNPQTPYCSTTDYHQFDFWLGDWDVFELDSGKHDATVRVDRALDGCAVREQYHDDSGMRGESLSIYDSTRKVWHQSWFTNRGRYLAIEGHLESGNMVLAGTYKDAEGVNTQVRGTWSPSGKDVRETAILSTDQGNTWKPWFDLIFRARNEATSGDDAKIVGALDTEFQAAVRNNDAATMSRILADDFILVTGSGKTQNKTDLLEESRSVRSIMSIRKTPSGRCACGAIRPWSPRSFGAKGPTWTSHSTPPSGSAIPTCELQLAGVMYSVRLPCQCRCTELKRGMLGPCVSRISRPHTLVLLLHPKGSML